MLALVLRKVKHCNPVTNSLPISNGLLNFLPLSIFHHFVKLNLRLTDVLHPACNSRLSSGAAYVSGFFMSKKLRKAILTGLGKEGKLPHDSRRPITRGQCILM